MPRRGNDTTLASSDEGSSVMLSVDIDVGSLAAVDMKGEQNGILANRRVA